MLGSSRRFSQDCPSPPAHMDRIGATMSREAMRMPSSAMSAVRRSAHVGSPFAFPWPNTCGHQKRSCSSQGRYLQLPPKPQTISHHPSGPRPMESHISLTLFLWASLLWMKHRQATSIVALNRTANSKRKLSVALSKSLPRPGPLQANHAASESVSRPPG